MHTRIIVEHEKWVLLRVRVRHFPSLERLQLTRETVELLYNGIFEYEEQIDLNENGFQQGLYITVAMGFSQENKMLCFNQDVEKIVLMQKEIWVDW